MATGLVASDHQVVIGTRDVKKTIARTEADRMGNPPFAKWHEEHPDVRLATFAEAATDAAVVVNATSGSTSMEVLEQVGASRLFDKPLVDLANPLDFSRGMPPTLSVCNTDSLAEQIQRAYPETKVVKTLNTMNARVMTEPDRVPGDHNVFMAGDDEGGKATVRAILRGLGWKDHNILDLGEITAARGLEMYLPLWLSLMQNLRTPDFNIKVVLR
jgi:hypothetical protein